jgi:hypothetical protein
MQPGLDVSRPFDSDSYTLVHHKASSMTPQTAFPSLAIPAYGLCTFSTYLDGSKTSSSDLCHTKNGVWMSWRLISLLLFQWSGTASLTLTTVAPLHE